MAKDNKKTYTVRYFDVSSTDIKKIVKSWENPANRISSHDRTAVHYVKHIATATGSSESVVTACLNKLRLSNLPKAGKVDGHIERELELEPDEGLVEKSYLALNCDNGSLVVQQNSSVCRPSSLPRIIAGIASTTIDNILPVTLKTTIDTEDDIVSIDLKFKPDPDQPLDNIPDMSGYTLAEELARIHQGFGAVVSQTISLQIGTGTGVRDRLEFLKHSKLGLISDIAKKFIKARIKILKSREEGEKLQYEIIDLLYEHKSQIISVEMDGKYPVEKDMVIKIKACASQD